MRGGPGRQPRGRDRGRWRSGGALVCEQGRGRKGGWPVGRPAGWGPAGSGKGCYDWWAGLEGGPAAERERRKGERVTGGPGFQI
jgi:hypothetical protein